MRKSVRRQKRGTKRVRDRFENKKTKFSEGKKTVCFPAL